MFAALPTGFPHLAAVARHSDSAIPPPPDIASLGEKVYRACVGRSAAQLSELRTSLRRRLPYAMWLDAQRDINADVPVVDWYYTHLGELEVDSASRTKRHLAPLLHTYVTKFNPASSSFRRLALGLQAAARRCAERELRTLQLAQLHHQFDFFNPAAVGDQVARQVLAGLPAGGVERWFESIGLWRGFQASPLGLHIFHSALRLPSQTYRDSPAIDTLITWARSFGKGLNVDSRALLAQALLNPWLRGDPSPDLQRKIGDFCVEVLGDPRLQGFSWASVSEAARGVLLRWLTRRTLDVFFDVLRHTADAIWQHRQEFWTSYYQQGYIAEAWAVLGPDAHRHVMRNYRGADLAYGRLSGQYDEGQSVLLMRMGDLLFCEWSHNGKLRVTPLSSANAPDLYKNAYEATELRFDSLPFKSNTGADHHGLPHLSSSTRWWQTTAAAFINRKLGIRR